MAIVCGVPNFRIFTVTFIDSLHERGPLATCVYKLLGRGYMHLRKLISVCAFPHYGSLNIHNSANKDKMGYMYQDVRHHSACLCENLHVSSKLFCSNLKQYLYLYLLSYIVTPPTSNYPHLRKWGFLHKVLITQ